MWNRERGLRDLELAPMNSLLGDKPVWSPLEEGQGEGRVAREPHPGGNRINGVLNQGGDHNRPQPSPAHEGNLGVSSPGGGEAFGGILAATGSGVVFVMGRER